jgi:WD40 repeat protein
MEKFIRGEMTEVSMKELRRVVPKKKLTVFVSSTFLDTNLERDVLHRKILPDLQKKAQQHEVQIILYDMRFGVKDENTKDHMTWVACKEAIQQCHEGSDGLFFLSLQADRYGYRPLPKYLDQRVMLEAVKPKDLTEETLNVLKEWYSLDENHFPPRYELRSLATTDGKINDPQYWDKVLPFLRDSVFDSITFETCASLNNELSFLVNRSVTEWETLFALDCDKERCYWVHRSFDKEKLKAFKSYPNHSVLIDGDVNVFSEKSIAFKLDNLKSKMKSILRVDKCSELFKQISPEDYFDETRCIEYLLEWERVTRDCLEKELEKVILKSTEWKKGFGDIPADHLEEIIHHCSTGFTKASSFIGREDLVQRARDIIKKSCTTDNVNSVFSGINLGLVGKSGCGKTALMSKLSLSASLDPTVPVIIRFCGTSKFSLSGLKLIQSISIQILAVYVKKDELKKFLFEIPSQDYKTAFEIFQKLMNEYPVYLFIDSLDQLENRYEERSKLTFLRDIKPHEQSKVVVSTLPDEYDEDSKPGKYFYHCEKTLKSVNVQLLYVGNVDCIETTIKELLVRRQRKLTNDQWIITLSEVAHEPTILYINLAMEVVCQWRSFERQTLLKHGVKGIIHQIFDGMEKSFGSEFTTIAFAMITFSREGVNDREMQDLLSLRDEVMKEVCQYSTLHCFPMHAWLRLKYVVKNIVTEKENHCIRWYHRQLWETANERYSEKAKECHEVMGRYFTNSFNINVMKEKDIMEQPLILNDVAIWLPECLVNRRRVIEGFYHLIEADLLNEAIQEICSLEFICASALCGDVFNLLRFISSCLLVFKGCEDKKKTLDHYLRWIRKRATAIASNPSWMVRSTAGEEPGESEVRRSTLTSSPSRSRSGDWNNSSIVTCARYKFFDKLELNLLGHSNAVTSVSWNRDSSRIVSASADKTVKIWDAGNGELLNTLEGHSHQVTSVSWNQDNSKIASGSSDKTIKVWDSGNGELLNTLQGHSKGVNSISWNYDSSRIVSASYDNTIKIWDAGNGEILNTLTGHFQAVISVSWNHDGSRILSGSDDKTIKMWDAANGQLLNTLEGHSHQVTSVSWNHDSSLVVSGSRDKTVRIWDSTNGQVLNILEGHSGDVTSVSWNRDSSKIASGSDDKGIKIWDARNGELLNTLLGHSTYISSISWNHDKAIKIWTASNGDLLNKLDGHTDQVSSVSWNNVGSRFVSGSWDKTIKIWNAESGELLNTLYGHSKEISSVSWNNDGSRIVSGSHDKAIKIWDAGSGELLKTLDGHSGSVNCVSWNHDSSKIASGSRDKTIIVWDPSNGELLNSLQGHSRVVTSVSWNHDGTKVVSGSTDLKIKVWDARNGELLNTLKGHSSWVTSVSWNQDGNRIVSGSYDKTIKIWDVSKGELLNTLEGHSWQVSSVSWNHDGSKIASGSNDKTIKLWDAESGQLLNTLEGHSEGVSSVRWNHDGSRIISGCWDKTIKIWSV